MHSIAPVQILKSAWSRFLLRPAFLVSLVVLMGAVSVVFQYALDTLTANPLQQFAVGLLSWVVQMLLAMGVIYIVLRVHDGKEANYGHLWEPVTHFVHYLLANICYSLIVLGGLILLIVPGIYWGMKFFFAQYLVIDRGLGPIEALKASGRLTDGVKWQMLGIFGLLLLIGIGISALAYALGAGAAALSGALGGGAPFVVMIMALAFVTVVVSYSVLSAYTMVVAVHLMRRLQERASSSAETEGVDTAAASAERDAQHNQQDSDDQPEAGAADGESNAADEHRA
jgi:hypothetical protein